MKRIKPLYFSLYEKGPIELGEIWRQAPCTTGIPSTESKPGYPGYPGYLWASSQPSCHCQTLHLSFFQMFLYLHFQRRPQMQDEDWQVSPLSSHLQSDLCKEWSYIWWFEACQIWPTNILTHIYSLGNDNCRNLDKLSWLLGSRKRSSVDLNKNPIEPLSLTTPVDLTHEQLLKKGTM